MSLKRIFVAPLIAAFLATGAAAGSKAEDKLMEKFKKASKGCETASFFVPKSLEAWEITDLLDNPSRFKIISGNPDGDIKLSLCGGVSKKTFKADNPYDAAFELQGDLRAMDAHRSKGSSNKMFSKLIQDGYPGMIIK